MFSPWNVFVSQMKRNNWFIALSSIRDLGRQMQSGQAIGGRERNLQKSGAWHFIYSPSQMRFLRCRGLASQLNRIKREVARKM